MEKSKRTNPKIRLALAIAVPVMVMVVTIAMVGASFAWFSDSATAEIATINLTTRDVFTLVFEMSSASESKYQGETAFMYSATTKSSSSKSRYLVNDYRAFAIYEYSAEGNTYRLNYIPDAPYTFKTTMNLNTDNRYINMNINFDTVKITKEITNSDNTKSTEVYASYGETISGADSNFGSSIIPYVFTWYMVKHTNSGATYYTPYGTIEYSTAGGYQTATKLNGVAVTSSTSLVGVTPSGMTNFFTDGTEQYDVYVVFCPEKLYWMQYFPADRDKSLDDIYTSTEISSYIVSDENPNRIYYSATTYWGSTFTFAADMSVSYVDWDRTVTNEEDGEET